jgi:large subunit ribosomal protein L21
MVTKTTEKKTTKATAKTAAAKAVSSKAAKTKNANGPKVIGKSAVHSAPKAATRTFERYAVLSFGTSQQLVCPGDLITVDLLSDKPGSNVELKDVLLVKDGDKVTIGKPHVAGAKVQASVMETVKGEKHMVFHKRRRKHSRKKTGHRQHYTLLKINEISIA